MALQDLIAFSQLPAATRDTIAVLARVLRAFNDQDIHIKRATPGCRAWSLEDPDSFRIEILQGEATPDTVVGIQDFMGPDFVVALQEDHINIEYCPD